jgi:hypothetical protein
MDFKDQWTLENALKILQHQTVDAKLWGEAVEWLLLYGPQEIRQLLLQASGIATKECFPELTAERYTDDGQACYDIDAIARALGISRNDACRTIAEKEKAHRQRHFIDPDETYTIH